MFFLKKLHNLNRNNFNMLGIEALFTGISKLKFLSFLDLNLSLYFKEIKIYILIYEIFFTKLNNINFLI